METIFQILLTATGLGVFGKYVFVSDSKTWNDAQKFCTAQYTDIASVSSNIIEKFRETEGTMPEITWTSLYRQPENITGWKWSGGGYARNIPWADGEPNNIEQKEFYVTICWTCNPVKCYDNPGSVELPFFCLNLIAVTELKTWEEALEYCRDQHTDLASLVSETEVLLAQKEIRAVQTTEHVWTGLRYLGDRWLWVNGDPLEYEAWTQEVHQYKCPQWSRRCGAMSKQGVWENRNCQEKLPFICY